MKRRFLAWLISFSITSIVIFALIFGYFSAKDGIEKYIDVKNNKTDVEYGETPRNIRIRLSFPNGKGLDFYLDFENKGINVSKSTDEESDYNIGISFETFGELVDRTGGLDIIKDGEEIRITGVTAAEMVKEGEKADEIMDSFMLSVCKKGLTREDFLYLLENCDTGDLSLVELFPYKDELAEMVKNISIST